MKSPNRNLNVFYQIIPKHLLLATVIIIALSFMNRCSFGVIY